MKNRTVPFHKTRRDCLTSEHIYRYVTQVPDKNSRSVLESHFADCPRCREELADVLELLHPSEPLSERDIPEPSAAEIENTVELIRAGTLKRRLYRNQWIPVAAAAAAAIVLVGTGIWGSILLTERWKSGAFLAKAKTELELVYEGRSPSDLRLDLPFHSRATSREVSSAESLHRAETYFHQALALRENLKDAHLGLASVYLSESQFGHAESEFQKILDVRENDPQALVGRGVTRYELARQSTDPIQRASLLAGALGDFDAALRQSPTSTEPLYDKIWVLFESGRHTEALKGIDTYLSKDSGSIWAQKLKDLKSRITLTNSKNVENEMERAAAARDSAALSVLAGLAPYQAPMAIRYALRRSLEVEGLPASPGAPNSDDLLWASRTLESFYGVMAGDRNYQRVLEFYAGLSPPQRRTKTLLDERFQRASQFYARGDFSAALDESRALEREYALLQDYWQLLNVYHLRGNSYYYGKADFRSTLASYRQMLSMAARTGDPDLIAKSLGALAIVCLEDRKLDLAQEYCARLIRVAGAHRLLPWQAFGSYALGDLYRYLNRLQDSRRAYTDALIRAYSLNYDLVLLNSLENLGAVEEQMGRLEDAQSLYEQAVRQLEISEQIRNPEIQPRLTARKSNLLYRQGDLFLKGGNLDRAKACFEESLRFCRSNMRELEARNRLKLADLYIRKKQYPVADGELERVLAIDSTGRYSEITWRARYLKGRMLHEAGADSSALTSYQSAVAAIEKIRRTVPSSSSRQSFLDNRFDPYVAIVSLLYHSLNDKRAAEEYVERSKAMTLREYLGDGSSNHGGDLDTISADAAFAQSTYRPTVLNYFLAEDEVFIFFEGRNHKEAISTRVARSDLDRQIAGFQESIRTHNQTLFHSLSRELYEELFEPVRTALEADEPGPLLILPDGSLHGLPFGALEDRNGIFLLEKRALVYAPSLRVYQHCLSLNKEMGSPARTILLLDGSANLDGACAELARVSRLYGAGSRIIAAKDLADCAQIAGKYEIFHFAGHADLAGGSASLSFQSAPGGLHLDSRAISAWNLSRTRLVNLAGCSTGLGARAEGEAPWGLVPAFLTAGAPAVLVSLMPVNDRDTEALNSRFYDLLVHASVPKAYALQRAQLALLSSERAAGNLDPASWAPYILIGDPR